MTTPTYEDTTASIIESVHISSICRSGAHHDLGSARVRVGPIIVTVSLHADGIKWPFEVTVPAELKERLAPIIEREFLQIFAERWKSQRLHDQQRALREAWS